MTLQLVSESDIRKSRAALSERDQKTFIDRGLIKVATAFDPQQAYEVQEELWKRFARWGIEPNRPETWESMDDSSLRTLMKATRRVTGLNSIYNEKVDEIAQTLTQEPVSELDKSKAFLLLTFSNQHEYIGIDRVPRSMWHSDTPNLAGRGIAGVIVLGFINRVEPKGGGTMVITGSHRLFESSGTAITSKLAKRKLKRHPYFQKLFSKQTENRRQFLDTPGYVENVEIKVEELTGDPGDAYFVNGSMLHTLCRNFNKQPRMMVRGFYGTQRLSQYYEEIFRMKQQLTSKE